MCASQVNPLEGQQVSIPQDRVSRLCKDLEYNQRYYMPNNEDSPLIHALQRNDKLLPASLLARVLSNEEVVHVKTFGQLQDFSRGGSTSYKLWLEGNRYIIAMGREDERVQELLDRMKLKMEIDLGSRLPLRVDNRNIRFIDIFRVVEDGNNCSNKVVITPQFCAGIGFYNSKDYSVEGNREAGVAGAWKIKGGDKAGFDLAEKWNNLLNPVKG